MKIGKKSSEGVQIFFAKNHAVGTSLSQLERIRVECDCINNCQYLIKENADEKEDEDEVNKQHCFWANTKMTISTITMSMLISIKLLL